MNMKTTEEDRGKIDRIMERACDLDERIDPLSLHMDLTATHLNGCPLNLEDLSETTDANLMHDVYGIMQHLNRNTGKLEGGFTPRYAVKQ
jgi:hypothetical protein